MVARLVAAMAEVDRLPTAATVTLTAVDPDHPDAQHCQSVPRDVPTSGLIGGA